MNPTATAEPAPYWCPRHKHPLLYSKIEDVFWCERCEQEGIVGPFRGKGLWMKGEVLKEKPHG